MRFPTDGRFAIVGLLAALCAAAGAQTTFSTAPCESCGSIVSIRMSTQEEQWTPLGVVSPSAAPTSPGGTESRTAFAFGSDGSSRGLVLIGSAGGAMYAKRPTAYQKPRWDVTVKMDRGDTRTLQQRYEPLLREGDRVRVNGTQLELVDS
jgi:outer membrane lipoprotein SlyB